MKSNKKKLDKRALWEMFERILKERDGIKDSCTEYISMTSQENFEDLIAMAIKYSSCISCNRKSEGVGKNGLCGPCDFFLSGQEQTFDTAHYHDAVKELKKFF